MALSPLFDIFDPQGTIRQRSLLSPFDEEDGDFSITGAFPVARRPQISDLMPDEEKSSLLGKLAAAGSSGLAGLGWILDTPGAMVRGLLSGGPAKAISALWDTTDERVEGRELLRQYGLAGQDDTWGNFGAGLGAEILLDPLTYASFGLNQFLGKGAKTVAGKAAAKAGLMEDFGVYAKNTLKMGEREALRKSTPRTLLDRLASGEVREKAMRDFLGAGGTEAMLDQPLARMNRIGVPIFGEGATDLYGKAVGDWAAKAGDVLGEGLMTNPYTGRAAREIERAFNPDVLGFVDRDRQWDAKTIMAARRAREKADRYTLAGLEFDANHALRKVGKSLNDPELSDALRNYMENGEIHSSLSQYFDLPEVQKLVSYVETLRDTSLEQAKKLGLPLDEFRSRTGGGWFPRQQLQFDRPQVPEWPEGVTPPERLAKPYTKGSRPVPFDDNLSRGRDEAYDVMRQSETLNRMSTDAELQAALRAADAKDARKILEDWWAANGVPPTTQSAPQSFWDDGILLREAGFDDTPPGSRYLGGDTVQATKARGPGDDLYGWMEELDDEGNAVYAAPKLPADHPLNRQLADLETQMHGLIHGSADPKQMAAINKQMSSIRAQIPEAQKDAWRDTLYGKLSDFLRGLDPQHAELQRPVFGQNAFNELGRYALGRGAAEANATEMLQILKRNSEGIPASQVVGGVNYTPQEALKLLGLTGETAADALAAALGVDDIGKVSFNKKFIDDWSRVMDRGRAPPELGGLMEAADRYTKRFKALALLWPSRYSRDAYSGAFAGAMRGGFRPGDWLTGTQIGAGDYSKLAEKIRHLPRYRDLPTDDAKVRQFLIEAGAEGLGVSTASDELLEGAGQANARTMYPGGAAPETESLRSRAKRASWKDWLNIFSLPTASGNANPLLEAGDRLSQFTDAGNRYGTYLTLVRKGYAPAEARRIANLTQVDYRPQAFTDFERNYLKRVFPFYSYTRGIAPLIADEIVNQPAGLMGMSTRAINRGGEPSEENFIPEYLRQSASIPLPEGMPLFGLDDQSKLKRFLTNIDLPFESAVNLITPGTGNTVFQKLGNTITKSALNVLGQTNPLVKGPLEWLTNRQFYSGRQLSDLYSMLEQTPLGPAGRTLEQIGYNLPGGSRAIGLARQVADDRLDPAAKWSKILVNALTGLKFQDVDMDRTRRLAARDMLNELLSTTPGVRTYENITVPPEVLAQMPAEQKQMYLLYKIIQSEAAKRARDKKKQQAAIDPLELLGVVQDQT